MKDQIAIVGAGIAGLSAGCYLQMNGYDTEIFEAHSLPGGLCTSWNRKGYQIEGCIHGLLGSASTHPLYKLWNELVEMDTIKFINSNIKHLFLFANGRRFTQYASLDKFRESIMEIAPEDKLVVDEFVRDIRKLQKVHIPYEKPKEFFDLPGKIKMLKALPLLPVIRKWINVSAGDFSERFQNPLLREAISHFSSPVLFEMFVLSEMDLERCGYPAIGSLEFSRRIEKKYISFGGKIHYNSRVRKVLVQHNTAVGLQLGDDQKRVFDRVVSAADGKGTIYDLLDGMYVDKTIERQYGNADLNPSKIQLSLGVKNTFRNWPRTVKVVLPAPYTIIDGSKFNSFDVLIYNDVEGFAPDNSTLLVIQLDTKNGDYWSDLRATDKVQYRKAKEAVAAALIDILGKRIEGIESNIEMVDVATPATYVRFTGNWRGSAQGWSNENIFRPNPFRKQLPGLKDFFMVGQWVEPGGGVPNVFRSGRDLAQIICKMDKRQFVVD